MTHRSPEDSDELQEVSKTPLKLVDNTLINLILGRVHAHSARVLGYDEAKENSTRWVFDIHTNGGSPISIELREFRSGRHLRPDLSFSFSITPTSDAFHDARVWAEESDGTLTIHSRRLLDRFSFRVAIDAMHSSTR